MKYKNGFTLLELLIVIAIIGGLSAVVIPQINDARKKAEYTKFYADVKAFYDGIHMYMTNKTQFPVHEDCQNSEYAHSMISNLNGNVEYSTVLTITNAPGWCMYQMPTSSTPTNNHILSLLSNEKIFTRTMTLPQGTQIWYGMMNQYYMDSIGLSYKCGSQNIRVGRPYLWGFTNATSTAYLPKDRAKFVEIETWSGDEYPMDNSFCFYID